MSFSSDVKKEVTTLQNTKKCCQLAEIAVFLRFSGSIIIHGGVGIKSSTDNPAVARYFANLIKEYFGILTDLSITQGNSIGKRHSYELLITPELNSDAILRECKIISVQEGSNYFTENIGSELVHKKCCKKAALRAAFLACGTVSNPKAKGYHLEISCGSKILAEELQKILENLSLSAKITLRREKYVVYLKDKEQVADFLSLIGATSQMFKLRDAQIYKELKGHAARIQNCEMANLEKSINASQKQLSDISIIENAQKFGNLSEVLRETAELRKEHPDLGLLELAALFNPPIKKSALNHRFERIAKIAKEIEEEISV